MGKNIVVSKKAYRVVEEKAPNGIFVRNLIAQGLYLPNAVHGKYLPTQVISGPTGDELEILKAFEKAGLVTATYPLFKMEGKSIKVRPPKVARQTEITEVK